MSRFEAHAARHGLPQASLLFDVTLLGSSWAWGVFAPGLEVVVAVAVDFHVCCGFPSAEIPTFRWLHVFWSRREPSLVGCCREGTATCVSVPASGSSLIRDFHIPRLSLWSCTGSRLAPLLLLFPWTWHNLLPTRGASLGLGMLLCVFHVCTG